GPSRTSSTHRPGVLADRPRDGLVLPQGRTAVTIRRRAASKRASSLDVREDPGGMLPPGFIAQPQPAAIEERGSDALPVDGMRELWARVFLRPEDDAGCR